MREAQLYVRASTQSRGRLDRRVRCAVRLVFPAGLGVTHMKEQQVIAECRRFALDRVRPQLERALVSAERGQRFATAVLIELSGR